MLAQLKALRRCFSTTSTTTFRPAKTNFALLNKKPYLKVGGQDQKFKTVRKVSFKIKIQPMQIHPILDKVFKYEQGGIDQLLREHTLKELVLLWHTEVEPAVKQRFIKVHDGNDIIQVIRFLCNESTQKICNECLD